MRLGQRIYCDQKKKIINTAFDMLTYVADRLEQQSLCIH